jgi:hypothetical protein
MDLAKSTCCDTCFGGPANRIEGDFARRMKQLEIVLCHQ